MTAEHVEPRLGSLWFGAMGGPLAWVIHNVGSYWVATVLCSVPGQAWILHGVTLITGVVALASALVGWRIRSQLKERPLPDGERISQGRALFMAGYGVISGIFFFVVILAEGIPGLLLDPCVPPM